MGHNTVNVNVINLWEGTFAASDTFLRSNGSALDRLDDRLTSIFSTAKLDIRFDSGSSNIWAGPDGSGCVLPPRQEDCCHPQGSLKTEGGKVTTPGGYTIEATKQHEWIITGPDGKTTRIWGDPHVAEGDGGKWDFKRDSTFVLGDGTKINVTTAPWKDGKMTVTSGLEIISGNDRVNITGIDKGKGEIGTVTQDGYAHSNCFGGKDVFVMGRESDDWSHQGREVIGSKNGGESFELGGNLEPGNTRPNYPQDNWDQPRQWIRDLLGFTDGPGWRNFDRNNGPRNDFAYNPYGGRNGNDFDFLRDSFRLVSRMMNLMERLFGMGDQFYANRSRSIYA